MRTNIRPIHLFYVILFSISIFAAPINVTVYAINDDCNEAKLRDLGVLILTCDNSVTNCSSTVTKLTGSDTSEKVFNYFRGKGLTPEQSAGIVGNMMQESGVNPERIQGGNATNTSKNPDDAGSLGWGLIQWTPGSKIINIAEQAGISLAEEGQQGRHIYDLDVQLDIVWWHLNDTTPTGRKNVLPDFKKTITVAEATEFFEDKVEGAGVPALERRINFANQALALYGDNLATEQAGSSANCGGSASVLGDGFVVYSQYNPSWKDTAYSTSTIGQSGCGPSAMAMIITAMTENRVTPVDTSIIAAENDMYVQGQGSKATIAPLLASHYDLQSESISVNIEDINAALRAGKMIFAGGSGAKPFTSGGHYIVIRGITPSGNWLVGDSGHDDTSEREWSPNDLIVQMLTRPESSYAISK